MQVPADKIAESVNTRQRKFLLREDTQNSASIPVGSEVDVVMAGEGSASSRRCNSSKNASQLPRYPKLKSKP